MIRYGLYLLGIAFVGWTAYTSMTQVRSHERAVIRRFGRVLEQKPEQGLHIGLPWGFDRVDLVPVGRDRTIKVGFVNAEEKDDDLMPAGQLLTGDHNLINVGVSIDFKVNTADMEKFVLHQDAVDAFVARAAEALLAEWVAGRKVDYVLSHGKSELPDYLHKGLKDRLAPYEIGVEFEHPSITKLDPPDQVKASFDRLAQAQSNIETQIKQAVQDANSKIDISKSEATRIAGRAKSYAGVENLAAVTEAANFLKRLDQYREFSRTNPDYINALWLEEVTQLFSRMKDGGRIGLLDHYLTKDGLTITQFPILPKKR